MLEKANLMFLIAETPVHAGSGSELGLVDLPIQREKHTNLPKIEASGIKGCLREQFESGGVDKESIEELFGPDQGDLFAGALSFTDAKLLLFPVKSLKGVFAWITCPLVLERLKEDLKLCGNHWQELEQLNLQNLQKVLVSDNSELLINNTIVLEEYTFEVEYNENLNNFAEKLAEVIFPQDQQNDPYKYWREKLKKSLVVLKDDDFKEFTVSSTEVITRTKIDDKTGTVAEGALWTEEYLPQDTILYSMVFASRSRKKNSKKSAEDILYNDFTANLKSILQLGGNQTIGKGLLNIKLLNNRRFKGEPK